jgi:predicted nicotinamide N-methyase
LSEYPAKFDVLIAADVIYEDEQVEPLLATTAAILKKTPDAELILAYARRNVPVDKVIACADRHGKMTTILDERQPVDGISATENIYSIKWDPAKM